MRLGFLVAVLAMFGGIVAFSATAHVTMPLFLSIPFVVLAAVLLLRRRGARMGEERGTIRVDDREITLEGESLIRVQELDGAWVAPHTELTKVILSPKRGRGMEIELRVHGEEDARRIVQRLGLDVDRRAVSKKVRSPIAAHTLPLVIMLSQVATLGRRFIAPNGPLPLWTMPVVVVIMLLWLIAASTSRDVLVGRDGIRIRWLGRTRFVPHRSIAKVETTDRGVVVHTVDGEAIDLALRPRTKKVNDAWRDEAFALRDRIERARRRDEGDGGAPDAKLLDPEARATKEWVASLRDPQRVETFRRGELDAAQLWRIVEDGDVEPAHRAAAAIALSPALKDEDKARLRVAASASAEPKLRVALEAAADDDEPAMTRAIDKLRRR
jgi:hypothetical protein